jgi:hypothetical protein
MMFPSSPQLPPRTDPLSHKVTATPPSTNIALSFPCAKNPIDRPSGEKKGLAAPSVPASKEFSLRNERESRAVG